MCLIYTGRIPSPKYVRSLRVDHGVRFRKAQSRARHRDQSGEHNIEEVNGFHDNMEALFTSKLINPSRLLVADETALGEIGIHAKRWGDPRRRRSFTNHTGFSSTVTVLATASADGRALPPFFVVKGKGDISTQASREKLAEIMDTCKEVAVTFSGGGTSSMDFTSFLQYGKLVAVAVQSSSSDPYYLVIDGCRIHTDPASLIVLSDLGLHVIFLPSWLTASLQVRIGFLCIAMH